MENTWNSPEHYTKSEIDEACMELVKNRVKTQLTSIELIKMLKSDDECKQYETFYATIIESILSGEKVSYPEKEQFLILHCSLLKVYKEIKLESTILKQINTK